MKRFVFWFVAALAAIALLKSSHRPPRWDQPPVNTLIWHGQIDHHGQGNRLVRIDSRGVTISDRIDDDDQDQVRGRDRDRDEDDDRDADGRVVVEGLPVPVEPGTRVTEARIEPPKPPTPPKPPRAPRGIRVHRLAPPRPPAPPKPPRPEVKVEPVTVVGRLSATEERARQETRARLAKQVSGWVAPEVPSSWKVPARLVDALIREVRVTPHEKGGLVGTMYDATMMVDLSPARRAEIVNVYNHEQTVKRLTVLGGGLAFFLVCLATVSGYIRTDEATKGYYTNRLRVASAAGLGAAGVLVYQWLV